MMTTVRFPRRLGMFNIQYRSGQERPGLGPVRSRQLPALSPIISLAQSTPNRQGPLFTPRHVSLPTLLILFVKGPPSLLCVIPFCWRTSTISSASRSCGTFINLMRNSQLNSRASSACMIPACNSIRVRTVLCNQHW